MSPSLGLNMKDDSLTKLLKKPDAQNTRIARVDYED